MHIKTIITSLLGICALMLCSLPALAQQESLEVRVHKNTLDGDLWTSTSHPIHVHITDQTGNGVGINLVGSSTDTSSDDSVLDPTQGALQRIQDTQCPFTWIDPDGESVSQTISIPTYRQLPAGEFVIPPVQIAEERILIESQALINCPSPSGTQEQYNALIQELSQLPPNPFPTTTPYLSLPLEPNLRGSQVTVSIAADPNDPRILALGLDQDDIHPINNQKIPGYTCRIPSPDDPDGTPLGEGLCQTTIVLDAARAQNGIFRTDLMVVSESNQPTSTIQNDPSLTQGINAELSEHVTMVGNFLIRTTSLLDWSLAIDETGMRNAKITTIYQTSLNIVNGFFILALLSIALLWNFSVLISKERLKRMMILFVIGIIGANFALPFTRLLVDGTNLLQQTLLVKEQPAPDAPIDSQQPTPESLANTQISASDILSSYDLDFGGFIGLEKTSYIQKNYPQELGESVNTDQLSQKSDLYVNRFAERTWFTLTLITLGAIGQLLIALIIVFRYVIIWFLLIFSPFIVVLALFGATQYLFRYWVWLYARWLLIGPILAMSLFIVVNIWSLSGVPLESSYAAPSNLAFPPTTNLLVSAPGITSGSLGTPREVMKYITSLIMLFLVIILPFWLTRPLSGNAFVASGQKSRAKKWLGRAKTFSPLAIFQKPTPSTPQTPSTPSSPPQNNRNISPLKSTMSSSSSLSKNITTSTSAPLPLSSPKTDGSNPPLANSTTKELVNTLNILSASQTSQSTSSTKNTRLEQQKESVMTELNQRAEQGDPIAISVLNESGTSSSESASPQPSSSIPASESSPTQSRTPETMTTSGAKTDASSEPESISEHAPLSSSFAKGDVAASPDTELESSENPILHSSERREQIEAIPEEQRRAQERAQLRTSSTVSQSASENPSGTPVDLDTLPSTQGSRGESNSSSGANAPEVPKASPSLSTSSYVKSNSSQTTISQTTNSNSQTTISSSAKPDSSSSLDILINTTEGSASGHNSAPTPSPLAVDHHASAPAETIDASPNGTPGTPDTSLQTPSAPDAVSADTKNPHKPAPKETPSMSAEDTFETEIPNESKLDVEQEIEKRKRQQDIQHISADLPSVQ